MECKNVTLYFDNWEEVRYYFRNVKLELEEVESNYCWDSYKYTFSFFKRASLFKKIINKLLKKPFSFYVPILDVTFASINSYKYKNSDNKDDGYYPSYKGTKEYSTEEIIDYILNIL